MLSNSNTVPVSIGTAIAIQSVLGYDAEGMPKKGGSVLKNFDAMYLNIRTLIRNFIGGVDTITRASLTADDVITGISTDLKIIKEVVLRGAGPHFKIFPYLCLFGDLENRFPRAGWRQADTPKQKAYKELEDKVLEGVKKSALHDKHSTILFFNTSLKKYVGSNLELSNAQVRYVILLTHLPIDLLSTDDFSKVFLLESHTGALKPSTEWNTKLKGFKSTMARLPFNSITVQLFGDTGDMFLPLAPTKMKASIIDLSSKYNWTPFTTPDRMIHCARLSHEPILAGEMMKLNRRF